MSLGKFSVWSSLEDKTAAEAASFAQRVERWGYQVLWIPESFTSNALVRASWLLANTSKLVVATGIISIYARDVLATTAGQYRLAEQSNGRFLLGLGVSHAPTVEGRRGHKYGPPVPTMRSYLEAMASLKIPGAQPPEKPKTVIAALGPKMLALAAELADGAHPYNVTPDHTAQAREVLGPGKLLCTEQMVVLEKDPAAARAAGRRTLSVYLKLPNYCNNLLRLGFTENDLAADGSDRLIDGLIAWGDEKAIRARLQQHLDAGADQVCIQSIPREGVTSRPADEKIFELLAPAAS